MIIDFWLNFLLPVRPVGLGKVRNKIVELGKPSITVAFFANSVLGYN